MLYSPILRASGYPGFWRRSMDEFRRQANIAIRMEGLRQPTKPLPMITFDNSGSIDRCKIMCDSDMGGFSKATLTHVSGSIGEGHPTMKADEPTEIESQRGTEPAHALFQGNISIELPPNKPNIQRSGYAAWRTRDRGLSLFGRLLWDIDPYSFLALRFKSDGRKYFVNIQTDSIVPTDLHQHLLPCSAPGEWETITIPFSQFVRTNYGMVVEPQKEMLRQKVRSIGIGLIDRIPGPFELKVAEMYATNTPARQISRADSGFDLRDEDAEESRGMMDEVEPRRKKGEPERILI